MGNTTLIIRLSPSAEDEFQETAVSLNTDANGMLRYDARCCIADHFGENESRIDFTVRTEEREITFYGPRRLLAEIAHGISTTLEYHNVGPVGDIPW